MQKLTTDTLKQTITVMQSQTKLLPDESLANDLLPIVLIATVIVAVGGCGALLIWEHAYSYASLLPALLLVSTWVADIVRQRGHIQRAGRIIAWTYGLLPAITPIFFGVTYNPLIFLAPLGIALAGLLISTKAVFELTRAFAILLVVCALLFGESLQTGFLPVCTALIFGVAAAALSWLAAYTVQGTIEWALETGQKSERREHLLRATQAELEQALIERDRLNDALKHVNTDLESARAAAEAAYRSKASFMATMSHELRTPLNLIIGFSTAMTEHPEMYADELLPELYRADISEIQQSGKHLLRLINEILDLAKIEAGKLELNKASLDLHSLLVDSFKSASTLIRERPIRIRQDFDAVLPPVLADEMRVRQVLLNLVSNACKFTYSGKIAIGARAETHQILVWVSDTGIGIEPADQERIFGEFEQVESHDAKQQNGTGLGLSICRWLIELHGGEMWLESVPGKGSTFFFTLPRVDVHAFGSAQPEMAITTSVGGP